MRKTLLPNGNLEVYIIENEQSLYRVCHKMIVEYLRESNIKKYMDTIKNILMSDKYIYHIKLLIASLLYGFKNPCELEKSLLLKFYLKMITMRMLIQYINFPYP